MRTKRCMTLIDFTCPSCSYLFWRHKITFKPRREFTPRVTFFKYFTRTCHVYHWTFFSNPKSYFYTHAGHLLKIASAIQYKSWYESRSVVAAMRTRTQFSAILCSKMGTLFGDVEGGRASDITAVSHKNVREKYSYALGEQRSPHSYAHSWM